MKTYNIAVILAGGTGSRIGGEVPKQFLPLADGLSVLEHSIIAFEQSPDIDEIALVMHPDHLKRVMEICGANRWQKVTKIIPGGNERWESSYHAIMAYHDEYEDNEDICLWFHDAARPYVSQEIIHRVAEALQDQSAVTVAVPVTDTLYKVESEARLVTEVPDRSIFMRAQTPQAFRYNVIKPAYFAAIESREHIDSTDDVGMLMRYAPGIPVFIVTGAEENKKITYLSDLPK